MAASTIASQMRRLTILILAGGLVASPAAAGAPLPSVLTQHARAPFQVRPATIDYTGDGTGFVGGYDGTSINDRGHIRWTTYRARSAVGEGLLWLIDSGTLHVVGGHCASWDTAQWSLSAPHTELRISQSPLPRSAHCALPQGLSGFGLLLATGQLTALPSSSRGECAYFGETNAQADDRPVWRRPASVRKQR